MHVHLLDCIVLEIRNNGFGSRILLPVGKENWYLDSTDIRVIEKRIMNKAVALFAV